ncbi:hypothetical protein MUG78_16830 [Gordonia alkaliphila]|uniref:hypothetical protein n=1 Tax=Gordonia alkaliphila TaxID=1053547 RepID=UPI001FF3436C|nr:hypothetical protein [Gordonia alkaliphila]MCK0441066.1 hypothetical protein [Gordonia alkaliphila]
MSHLPLTIAVIVCLTLWALMYLIVLLSTGSETFRRTLSRFGTPPKRALLVVFYGTYLATVLLLGAGMVVGIHAMVSFVGVLLILLLALDLVRHPV